MRVGVDVVQPDPRLFPFRQRRELAHELRHPRAHRPTRDEVGAIAQVDAVGARVLRDHQQLPDAALQQALGFAHDLADRARHEVAAHRGDDAEAATMIAAFGDLEIGVMLRRQLDAVVGDQVHERIVRLRKVHMHVLHHLRGRVRAGDREHLRMDLRDDVVAGGILLRAEATGDDHLAVLGQRLADGIQRLLHGRVDEAAGVDDHEVRAVVGRRRLVAFGAQAREDLLGVDERLRTTERDEADARRRGADVHREPVDRARRSPETRTRFTCRASSTSPPAAP